MGISQCTVATQYGRAEVEQTSVDSFRVVIEAAAIPGSSLRYTAIAHLFMSDPGQFVEFTPDGFDRFLMLPHGITAEMPDAAAFAADLDAGAATLVPADEDYSAESKLREAVRDAARNAFDRIYGAAEDFALETGFDQEPSLSM